MMTGRCKAKVEHVFHRMVGTKVRKPVCELEITYTVKGKEYRRIVSASPDELKYVGVGSEVEILYNPSKPEKCDRKDLVAKNNGPKIMLVGAVLSIIGLILMIL